VISRLIDGCTTFNAIQRGVPRISPSLLSKRLAELERAGVVEKRMRRGQVHPSYALTHAGEDLGPVIDQLAVWGHRWARDLEHEDLDPAFLAWSMSTRVDTEALPAGRTVIEFDFENTPGSLHRFWIVFERGTVEMCLHDPGFEPSLRVHADLRLFVETWRGFRDLRSELRAGRIRLAGPAELKRRFPDWLLLSGLAPHERLWPGKERALRARKVEGRSR
jgi:DNA-binding HxlR family transcriptional regulator